MRLRRGRRSDLPCSIDMTGFASLAMDKTLWYSFTLQIITHLHLHLPRVGNLSFLPALLFSFHAQDLSCAQESNPACSYLAGLARDTGIIPLWVWGSSTDSLCKMMRPGLWYPQQCRCPLKPPWLWGQRGSLSTIPTQDCLLELAGTLTVSLPETSRRRFPRLPSSPRVPLLPHLPRSICPLDLSALVLNLLLVPQPLP